MSTSTSTPYTEPDNGDPDKKDVVAGIKTHLEHVLSPYEAIDGKTEYIQSSYSLPDSYTELYYVLTNHPCATHKWLWLLFVHSIAITTQRILLLEQRIKQTRLRGVDPSFLNARAAYAQSFCQLSRFTDQLLQEIDLDWVISDPYSKNVFLDILTVSIDICLIDPVSLYTLDSLVTSMARSMLSYSQKTTAFGSNTTMDMGDTTDSSYQLFAIVVRFGKLAYLSGNCMSSLFLIYPDQGVPLVSEKFVPVLVSQNRVSLNDIVDFYRYYAYSLVTVVVEHDTINDTWLNKADIFLRVLLHLPSLHIDNYVSDMGSAIHPSRYISAVERGEISFFFILAYLMRLSSFSDLVDPDKYFRAERSYFLASLNKRVATELDISASSSSSRAGSVVSMSKVTEQATVPPSHTTNRTISSILSQGSYKEKVRLVVDFLNLIGEDMTSGSIRQIIHQFDFASLHQLEHSQMNPGDSDILHVLSRIDKHVYPGKALFVSAIDKIIRLLQLLALKEFSGILGPSIMPAKFLAEFLESNYTVDEILSTKRLLVMEGDTLSHVGGSIECSEEALILRQFDTLELTEELERAIAFIK